MVSFIFWIIFILSDWCLQLFRCFVLATFLQFSSDLLVVIIHDLFLTILYFQKLQGFYLNLFQIVASFLCCYFLRGSRRNCHEISVNLRYPFRYSIMVLQLFLLVDSDLIFHSTTRDSYISSLLHYLILTIIYYLNDFPANFSLVRVIFRISIFQIDIATKTIEYYYPLLQYIA
jgi:hypothetical protein